MDIRKNDTFRIVITDLSDEGLGIGRLDGFIWFVKDALTGDTVLASATRIRKSFGYARLVSILEPSPLRTDPPCPIASRCGGCQLQQLSYSAQLEFKRRRVLSCLRRIGGFDIADDFIEDIIGMEDPFRYRSKAVYPIGRSRDGRIISGFYAGRTHNIIECGDCLIGAPENASVLSTVTGFMEEYGLEPYDEKSGTGTVRHVLVRKGFATGQIMAVLVINSDDIDIRRPELKALLAKRLKESVPALRTFALCVNKKKTNAILDGRIDVVFGPGYIEDIVGGITFRISPRSFFQVNPVNMRRLYDTAVEFAGLTGTEHVWDLYCGVGSISLFMALHAANVYGVEVIPEAVVNARENARINGISNTRFYTGRAEEVLPAWASSHTERTDVIVVDPPRKGCDEKCLRTMLELSPRRIVYVSCDPATMARDLRYLADGGFRLERVRPCDMFPNTVHVETVCLLSNRKCASSEPKPELAQGPGERRNSERSLLDFVNLKPDTYVDLSLDMEDYRRIKAGSKE